MHRSGLNFVFELKPQIQRIIHMFYYTKITDDLYACYANLQFSIYNIQWRSGLDRRL